MRRGSKQRLAALWRSIAAVTGMFLVQGCATAGSAPDATDAGRNEAPTQSDDDAVLDDAPSSSSQATAPDSGGEHPNNVRLVTPGEHPDGSAPEDQGDASPDDAVDDDTTSPDTNEHDAGLEEATTRDASVDAPLPDASTNDECGTEPCVDACVGERCASCEAGAQRCSDPTTLLTCSAQGGWTAEACPEETSACDPTLGCVACVPDQERCTEGVPERCREDASGWDVARCADINTPRACDDAGNWAEADTCPVNTTCDEESGACSCPQNDTLCLSNASYYCTGTAWELVEDCSDSDVNPVCAPGLGVCTCSIGSYHCSVGDSFECNASRVWILNEECDVSCNQATGLCQL